MAEKERIHPRYHPMLKQIPKGPTKEPRTSTDQPDEPDSGARWAREQVQRSYEQCGDGEDCTDRKA